MHIGGDDRTLDRAVVGDTVRLTALRRAVADARDDAAEGGRVGPQDGAAAVIFEAGEGLGEAVKEGNGHELADGAVPLRLGRNVEDAHAGNAQAARILVPVAQDLQGGADRQEGAARVEGPGQARGAAELVGRQRLRGVLSPTQRVDVEAVGDVLGQPDVDHLGLDAAPAGSLGQDQGVARVPVGAEHLGHEDADSQGGSAHRLPSFRSSTILKSRIAV